MQEDVDFNKIIENDKKLHPGCSYSQSLSKSCSSLGGNGMTCRTIQNLQRLCPNSRPEIIYSKEHEESSDKSSLGESSNFPSFPRIFDDFNPRNDSARKYPRGNDAFHDMIDDGIGLFRFFDGMFADFDRRLGSERVENPYGRFDPSFPRSFPNDIPHKNSQSNDQKKPPKVQNVIGPVESI